MQQAQATGLKQVRTWTNEKQQCWATWVGTTLLGRVSPLVEEALDIDR